MKPNSMYSEVLEVTRELEALKADCLITFGGGSLIDAGKGAILASLFLTAINSLGFESQLRVGSCQQDMYYQRARRTVPRKHV